ncbi:MAG: hypothetical protein H6Q89_3299, partial [Myxococcaceae bacterium]|nr:hypothetical protein [Myxococcaceae bacterium]
SYTYLRLSTASGEQWAAIPTTAVAVGTEVRLANPTVMTNFVSKTLSRTFPEIYFSTGIAQPGGAPAHAAAPTAAPAAAADPQTAALAAWAEQADPVAKATGPDAKTVAEIYLQRAALTDKAVLLRGKVVKYTAGVMGKNWLHLRDGTGNAQSKDHDITVTTGDQAAVGEVVSVRGPVHVDRDFGAGYVFPVMIEDAKVVR